VRLVAIGPFNVFCVLGTVIWHDNIAIVTVAATVISTIAIVWSVVITAIIIVWSVVITAIIIVWSVVITAIIIVWSVVITAIIIVWGVIIVVVAVIGRVLLEDRKVLRLDAGRVSNGHLATFGPDCERPICAEIRVSPIKLNINV